MSTLSSDQKLDFIINEMAKLRETTAEIATLVTRVTTLETKVTAQDAAIASLTAEVKYLKESFNDREQFFRMDTLRIFNVPGSNNETGLSAKVYDTLLKPILAAARANGDLPTLPQVGNTISEIFRAGRFAQGANKPPPPIIVKFCSSNIRMAILRNKRNNTPPPEVGNKRITIVEDLTPPNHKKMRDLLADERVEKVWTLSGSIWFSTKKDKKAIKVKSPYESNDSIIL